MNKETWKHKKVLITGHEGFLGSWLTRTLIHCGGDITGIDIVKNRPHSVLNERSLRRRMKSIKVNIADLKSVERIIKRNKPQVIFHLAAEAIVPRANRFPVRAFKSNIEGTWNILEVARTVKGIQAMIIASSDKAYGSHKNLPYVEEASLKGNHPYDVSKSCADLIAYTYAHTYGVPVATTRCGNIYGPGDTHFSRIVPDTIRCMISGRKLIIRSDGKFTRDYVYVDDIVNGYIMLAEQLQAKKLHGEAFNFSEENPVTVLKLVNIIYKLGRKKPNYKILNKAHYEIIHQYLCSQKARKTLHWNPKHSLEDGLVQTIDWYKKILGTGERA